MRLRRRWQVVFREEVTLGFTFDGGNPHKRWIGDVEEGKTSPGQGKNWPQTIDI